MFHLEPYGLPVLEDVLQSVRDICFGRTVTVKGTPVTEHVKPTSSFAVPQSTAMSSVPPGSSVDISSPAALSTSIGSAMDPASSMVVPGAAAAAVSSESTLPTESPAVPTDAPTTPSSPTDPTAILPSGSTAQIASPSETSSKKKSSKNNDNDSSASSAPLSSGAKVGIAISTLIGSFATISAIAFFLWRKRRNKYRYELEEDPVSWLPQNNEKRELPSIPAFGPTSPKSPKMKRDALEEDGSSSVDILATNLGQGYWRHLSPRPSESRSGSLDIELNAVGSPLSPQKSAASSSRLGVPAIELEFPSGRLGADLESPTVSKYPMSPAESVFGRKNDSESWF